MSTNTHRYFDRLVGSGRGPFKYQRHGPGYVILPGKETVLSRYELDDFEKLFDQEGIVMVEVQNRYGG